jgi:hypothetical protein
MGGERPELPYRVLTAVAIPRAMAFFTAISEFMWSQVPQRPNPVIFWVVAHSRIRETLAGLSMVLTG